MDISETKSSKKKSKLEFLKSKKIKISDFKIPIKIIDIRIFENKKKIFFKKKIPKLRYKGSNNPEEDSYYEFLVKLETKSDEFSLKEKGHFWVKEGDDRFLRFFGVKEKTKNEEKCDEIFIELFSNFFSFLLQAQNNPETKNFACKNSNFF